MTAAYEYVNKTYGTDFKPGMLVTIQYSGETGTVARKRHYTHYVFVKLEGAKHSRPYHPSDLTPAEPSAKEAPLECMYCPALGPMYPIDADHAGWMCDQCYQKMQNETENEG